MFTGAKSNPAGGLPAGRNGQRSAWACDSVAFWGGNLTVFGGRSGVALRPFRLFPGNDSHIGPQCAYCAHAQDSKRNVCRRYRPPGQSYRSHEDCRSQEGRGGCESRPTAAHRKEAIEARAKLGRGERLAAGGAASVRARTGETSPSSCASRNRRARRAVPAPTGSPHHDAGRREGRRPCRPISAWAEGASRSPRERA